MDTWMFTPVVVVTLLLLAGPGALGEEERGPPSAPEDLLVVRQSSASVTIHIKAPKQEEQVREYFVSYNSVECCNTNRWLCSRPRVADCSLISYLYWQYVNESSLPVIVIDFCAGQTYSVLIRAINDKGSGPYSYTMISANGSRSDDGTSSSHSSTSSPKETSSSPSSPSNETETSSSPSSPSNTTKTSSSPSSPSNTTVKPRIILDPPSPLKEVHFVRLSSALAAINVKAPKPEDRVAEIYIFYHSVECRGAKRWNCSRHAVTSCSLQGFHYWRYVNESSSLPVVVSRLCPGQAYDIYITAINEQFTFGPGWWLYVHGNVDGIRPSPSSPSNTAETSSLPPSPSHPTENPLTTQVLLAGNQTTETPDKLTAAFTTTQLALGGIAVFSMFLMIVLVLRIRSLVTAKRRRESLKNQKLSTKSRDFDCVLVLSPSGKFMLNMQPVPLS
ncbi:uncharacterized protein LOC135826064 [Sycon ciliatum]|uniref:uncharacterized protein LOC135826064 n=1 Tax=Sycon ciliatum TaxID=27933 RepID=UPI0031F61325